MPGSLQNGLNINTKIRNAEGKRMSDKNTDRFEQKKIVNAVFRGNFGPIKSKVVWISWADMPNNMSVMFQDDYVLYIWKKDRPEKHHTADLLYGWNLTVVSDEEEECFEGEYENMEILRPCSSVFWGSGEIEVSAPIKIEEVARKVMQEALNAVYIEGDSLPENSEQLVTAEETEKLYGLTGPFYLITDPREAAKAYQLWRRGEFGLQRSS
jgi:hypothetical protein